MKVTRRYGIAPLLFGLACSGSPDIPESSSVETHQSALSTAAAPSAKPEPAVFAQPGDPNRTVPSMPIILKGDITDDSPLIPSVMPPSNGRNNAKPARSGPFRP